jgi:hypothetical protein
MGLGKKELEGHVEPLTFDPPFIQRVVYVKIPKYDGCGRRF